MTTAPARRRVVDARPCAATRQSHTAELERAAVPRLRMLAGVFAVLATSVLAVFAMIERGLIDGPALGWRIGLVIGQLAAALSMIAATFVARWPARRIVAIGIAFQIAAAASLAILELDNLTLLAVWILNFALVPTTPRRAALAAYGSAAMLPVALGTAVALGLHPPPHALELLRCGLMLAIATIAVITARAIYGLKCGVADARQLGAYELVEPLGEGGMGEVWRARHRTLVRPAAIKLIRHALTAGLVAGERAAINRRFRFEVQATAMLTSPHTVAVYDFGETDGGELYYVMELLHGLDAERLIANHGPQPAERVIHLLRQACASLDEAHRRALVHRDIKPANLYLCAIGTELDFVKVLDFGLVHGVDRGVRLTVKGSVSGTPAYLAPETAARGVCDARSDIYALGCVAYWLLTGTLVFEAELPAAMMAAHIRDCPEPPSRRTELAIPPALEVIVLSCLAKDPAARPQSAGELDRRLAAVPAASWSRDDAEAWWRTHVPETLARAWHDRALLPDPPAARPGGARDHRTVDTVPVLA